MAENMAVNDIKRLCAAPDISIRQAIRLIDEGGKKVVFVTDSLDRLLGIFTDGDMRRWLLAGGELDTNIGEAMNRRPFTVSVDEASNEHEVFQMMSDKRMLVLPVVENGRLIKSFFWDETRAMELMRPDGTRADIPVVIMAGGQGKRLYPLTRVLPKPLIPIDGVPIVDRIIQTFSRHGCGRFIFSLNYKADIIKAYYETVGGDYKLEYVSEDHPLGTAGSLSLMRNTLDGDFFVTNCDTVLNVDYANIYKNHIAKKSAITVVSTMVSTVVPYGVLHLDDAGDIVSIEEKPEITHLVNSGVYLMSAEVLGLVKDGEYLDMPTLIERAIEKKMKVSTYPISEHDMTDFGQLDLVKKIFAGE